MAEKKEVSVVEAREVNVRVAPSALIELAISKGADLDKLDKLLTLQERYETMEAKKAYNKAMSDFKANPPEINKDKKVGYKPKDGGRDVSYRHASLYNVTDKINSELSKHGLSASWTTKQNGVILVTCKITHVRGHSEETTLSAAADTSGAKNAIQAIGSTITYLERYTLLALTGLATFEEDDDGQATAVEYIDDKMRNELTDLAVDCGADMPKFMAYLKVEDLTKLPKADFQKAKLALIAKKGKAKK
jgi:hypothetical protein